ncbi:hypothetical protein MLD38_000691 [Melastoma candidum]|uniref:Uncharacterized protein n=1 Tax=Melastoma candidum TaxID=119954 RepID=A0ACB9SJJ1_9MYRT|nr:hypothetical protein MLD38_000691 [Melastoma candidum]
MLPRILLLRESSSRKANMGLFISVLLVVIPVLLLFISSSRWRKGTSSARLLPPGSLGLPVIGQSIALLRAMKANKAEEWIRERARRYGPVSKMSLFGKPTVFIHGPAANKFVFTGDGVLSNKQVQSIRRILGEYNLLELSGVDHKRVRESLMTFLRPESLKHCIGKIEEEVRRHIELEWDGQEKVTVLPLMKKLTFNIICDVLFGLERGAPRDDHLESFQTMIEGMWSIPVNLPFTRYNRSLCASARVQEMLKRVVHNKRRELEKDPSAPQKDMIACLLSKRDDSGEQLLTDEEIIHNAKIVMVAGHDTSSVLITFMIRQLSNSLDIYEHVLKEQEEIAKSKGSGQLLTWEDLSRMKYTWRVAMETLRTVSPIFGGFRLALEDIEYDGYIIPKGWQVFWAANMTHMNESIFPEPSTFDPSRFEVQASIPPYSFIPFGGGPRICPGMEFARIETLVTIHYLMTRFTWKLLSENSFIRDPMPLPSQGLVIGITPKDIQLL